MSRVGFKSAPQLLKPQISSSVIGTSGTRALPVPSKFSFFVRRVSFWEAFREQKLP